MDQKNFIVALVLSVLIIVGWQAAFPPAKPPVTNTVQQTTPAAGAPAAPAGVSPPGAPATAPAAAHVLDRAEALKAVPRVTFNTPELVGSISLKGGRIDDVELAKYRVELDPKSPPVPVLSPVGGPDPYYAEFGWSSSDAGVKLPGPETLWTASKPTLEPGQPVTLTWDNGQGLIFSLEVALDEHF